MGRPIVFLDMDGVLCTVRSHFAYRGDGLMLHLDPVGVKLVERLCEKADAEIVLSSSWRTSFDLPAMTAILQNAGFANVSFHSDWATPKTLRRRGHEIKSWIEEHPLTGNYVILDDDNDMLEEQKPHFVQTDTNDGFLWNHYEKACKILGCES